MSARDPVEAACARLRPVAPPQTHGSGVLLWLCAAAIAILPISVLPSGNPQPAHGIIALFVVLSLTAYFAPLRYDWVISLMGGFWLLDVMVVNLVWWLITGTHDQRFVVSIFYHSFNLGMMLCAGSLLAVCGDRGRTAFRIAIAISIVIELAVTLVGMGVRNSGTFDNPNNLGYWAILVAAAWLALKPNGERLQWSDTLVLVAVLFLCFVSASRAAILGAGILIVVTLIWHGVSKRAIPAMVVAGIATGIIAWATSDAWIDRLAEQAAVTRFDQEKRHDSFAGRGYDRIWLFPQYVLTGAGEGEYVSRFSAVSEGGGNEIHSTFAGLLVSYGIIGTFLLGGIIWRIFSAAGLRYVALAAPIVMYGMGHNGLRETMLWTFLSIVLSRSGLLSRRGMR